MNTKIAASLLLSISGLILTIDIVGNQLALAFVKAGFYIGHTTGAVPPGPESAGINWMVLVAAMVLAALGFYCLFCPTEK